MIEGEMRKIDEYVLVVNGHRGASVALLNTVMKIFKDSLSFQSLYR